jgi:hypothetical protein
MTGCDQVSINWLKPDFSFCSCVNTACGAHASCSSMALFLEINPYDFVADHFSPSRGEVKNPHDFIFFLIAFMVHYLVSQSDNPSLFHYKLV